MSETTFLVLSQFYKIWYSWRTTDAQCFQGGDRLILNDIRSLKASFWRTNTSKYTCETKHGG